MGGRASITVKRHIFYHSNYERIAPLRAGTLTASIAYQVEVCDRGSLAHDQDTQPFAMLPI
jgi:hypothetical protein